MALNRRHAARFTWVTVGSPVQPESFSLPGSRYANVRCATSKMGKSQSCEESCEIMRECCASPAHFSVTQRTTPGNSAIHASVCTIHRWLFFNRLAESVSSDVFGSIMKQLSQSLGELNGFFLSVANTDPTTQFHHFLFK